MLWILNGTDVRTPFLPVFVSIQSFSQFFLPPAGSVAGGVVFSCVSVCQSFCPREGGSPCTGSKSYPPVSGIWWPRLEIFSKLFSWEPPGGWKVYGGRPPDCNPSFEWLAWCIEQSMSKWTMSHCEWSLMIISITNNALQCSHCRFRTALSHSVNGTQPTCLSELRCDLALCKILMM